MAKLTGSRKRLDQEARVRTERSVTRVPARGSSAHVRDKDLAEAGDIGYWSHGVCCLGPSRRCHFHVTPRLTLALWAPLYFTLCSLLTRHMLMYYTLA